MLSFVRNQFDQVLDEVHYYAQIDQEQKPLHQILAEVLALYLEEPPTFHDMTFREICLHFVGKRSTKLFRIDTLEKYDKLRRDNIVGQHELDRRDNFRERYVYRSGRFV